MSFGIDFKELEEGREPEPMSGAAVLFHLCVFFFGVIGMMTVAELLCALAGVPFDVRAG